MMNKNLKNNQKNSLKSKKRQGSALNRAAEGERNYAIKLHPSGYIEMLNWPLQGVYIKGWLQLHLGTEVLQRCDRLELSGNYVMIYGDSGNEEQKKLRKANSAASVVSGGGDVIYGPAMIIKLDGDEMPEGISKEDALSVMCAIDELMREAAEYAK